MLEIKEVGDKLANAKKTTPTGRVPIAQVRKENEDLRDQIREFNELGYCYMCDTHKSKDRFYTNTDPMIASGITPICKLCARKIALNIGKDGVEHPPTKESVKKALKYLNKPFLNSLWDASIQESENETAGKTKNNAWTAYIKNIAMRNWNCMTYDDSDFFKYTAPPGIYDAEDKTMEEIIQEHAGQDTYDRFLKNKEDVIRLLDYDPFEKELPEDQPQLYAQLIGLLDSGEESNADLMRNGSCILIVRGLLQASKVDDAIAKLMGDVTNIERNSASIKSLQDSKNKITNTISTLCKDSCISLQYNKNAKKGENTWTGKIKRIKELNLREGEVNGFDLETCRAMRQVMDQSNESIMKQLHLDESEWSDIVADQRSMITQLQSDLDKYIEISRILLRENLDIKDTLREKEIDLGIDVVDLNELFSCFSGDGKESNNKDGDSDAT